MNIPSTDPGISALAYHIHLGFLNEKSKCLGFAQLYVESIPDTERFHLNFKNLHFKEIYLTNKEVSDKIFKCNYEAFGFFYVFVYT